MESRAPPARRDPSTSPSASLGASATGQAREKPVSPLASPQRKALQLRVLRSFRRKLALIENKLVGGHFAEIKLAHRGDPLFEHGKRSVGAVGFAPFRGARSSPGAGARQSQMRTVRPIFARNAEFGDAHIDTLSQVAQLRSGVNSDPENTRSLCRGEESISASANFEPARFNPPQTFRDGLDLLWRLFSDELQRNVQRLRPHPAGIGREALDAFEETLDPGADFSVEIDADKYSHLDGCVGTGLWPVLTGRSPV